VVDAADQVFEAAAEPVADERHQRLKSAEVRSGDEHLLKARLPGGQALADRNREGVHAQADGD